MMILVFGLLCVLTAVLAFAALVSYAHDQDYKKERR